jgi:hypothetical protein
MEHQKLWIRIIGEEPPSWVVVVDWRDAEVVVVPLLPLLTGDCTLHLTVSDETTVGAECGEALIVDADDG